MNSKKYLQKREDDLLHIGNLVAWIIQENHSKKKDVSQALSIASNTLNKYFKHSSLQAAILWRLSKALDYNFFMFIGQKLKIEFETDTEKELKKQLAEKEELVTKMKIELDLLKKIHKIDS